MWSLRLVSTILTLAYLSSQATAQFTSCVQSCIDQYTSQSCSLTDFPCICRQSSGQFLQDVVSCSHDKCDTNVDNSVFLTPLSIICQLAGAPLPAAAVSSAQIEASSYATQPATVTANVTQIAGSSSEGGGLTVVPTSTGTISGQWTTATYDGNGGPTTSTYFGASPSTTASPATSSYSFTRTSGLVPIVLTTTNNAGSSFTTTSSQGVIIVQPSPTQSSTSGSGQSTSSTGSGSSPSVSHTSSTASSLLAGGGSTSKPTGVRTSTILTPEKTTSAQSSTTTTSSGGGTDSAPFTNTNLGTRECVGGWFGLSVLLAFAAFWL